MDSLQIPDHSIPGPSRSNGSNRPVSVSAHPTPPTSASHSSRKRASHQVTSSNQQEEQVTYRDVYSHPAAQAYAASHPRRTIPVFGPYLLLQTLGEGEFGKVKLGLHMKWGEEVAVKLIKRNNVEAAVRMGKVEREIAVLKALKHPNIVHLYEVVETDKYIGIILDYASGGELFDHILAHRYLKEKDACKLFSQLLSGVWYIHRRKIVHRDLKLENLLLDRNRNVIITDFGFANHFEHRADDLMQTSCGSPCYAAPELVISEGAYVGSAVDIWSCGVILYAMLAGYLPFDDDPANPDGDNINLLYRYIVNTPLSFPEYVSEDARDLLGLMLQPDPVKRAGLPDIMQHRWLAPYRHLFDKSVEDLEASAMELQTQKRLAYQRQMRQHAESSGKVARSQSARTDVFPHASVNVASASRSRSQKEPHYAQPEYLYETSADVSASYIASPTLPPAPTGSQRSRRAANSAIVLPTVSHAPLDDDPFAPTPSREKPPVVLGEDIAVKQVRREDVAQPEVESVRPTTKKEKELVVPNGSSPQGSKSRKSGMRHTIQVEYGEEPPVPVRQQSQSSRREREKEAEAAKKAHRTPSGDTPKRPSTGSHAPIPSPFIPPAADDVPTPPLKQEPPVVTINTASPPPTPSANAELRQASAHVQAGSASTNSGSSSKSRHRKGLSMDKIGLSKIFGSSAEPPVQATNGIGSRRPSESSAMGAPSMQTTISRGSSNRRPSTMQVAPSVSTHTESTMQSPLLSPSQQEPGDTSVSTTRSGRRGTLSLMVEPLSRTIGRRGRGRDETPIKEKEAAPVRSAGAPTPPSSFRKTEMEASAYATKEHEALGLGMPASTSKARKVMQWFRSRSKGPRPDEDADAPQEPLASGQQTPVLERYRATPSSTSVNNAPPVVPQFGGQGAPHPVRTASGNEGFAERVRRHVAPPNKGVLRVHHGAVDHSNITTAPPPEVMRHVQEVLEAMGIEVQVESEYKYRCIRAKRRRGAGVGLGLRDGGVSAGSGLAAFMMVGSAASNGVDKRGLPVPSPSFGSTGGMLKGLLMRRQSSQVSAHGAPAGPGLDAEPAEPAASPSGPSVAAGEGANEPVYGDPTQDQGDEVRFSVELTRLDRLNDTFSLDIRRLKGNLRSYKFLYDSVRDRVNLQQR